MYTYTLIYVLLYACLTNKTIVLCRRNVRPSVCPSMDLHQHDTCEIIQSVNKFVSHLYHIDASWYTQQNAPGKDIYMLCLLTRQSESHIMP